MYSSKHLSLLADRASDPAVLCAESWVTRCVGKPNYAVWAGAMIEASEAPWNAASHILLMGVRGTPSPITPARGQVRPDNPWRYIARGAGSRRDTPIPLDACQASMIVWVLKKVSAAAYPGPDLLALAGWERLNEVVSQHNSSQTGWERLAVLEAVAARVSPTDRLREVQKAFHGDVLHKAQQVVV